DAGDVVGVVAGLAEDVAVAHAEALRGLADEAHAAGIEALAAELPLAGHAHLDAGAARAVRHRRLDLGPHPLGHLALGVTDVAGELRVLRQDAGLVGPGHEPGDGGLALGRVVRPADLVDRHGEHRRADERVAPAVHRRGSGVRGLAVDVDVHAADGVAAGHDADRHRLAIEDRALLDVQLEVGVDGTAADRRLAVVADPLQLVAEALAVVVGQP